MAVWVLDLDGVVWLAGRAIGDAAGAIGDLRRIGDRVLFLTNNSMHVVADQAKALQNIGIDAEVADVCTSAQAAATLVEPGARVLVVGGPGVQEALRQRGAHPLHSVERGERCDAVIIGFHRDFDYERLKQAFLAVESGAQLIGTNQDATYPTPEGPIPGGGSLVAAAAYACGVAPVFAGKPFEPAAQLVFERLGWDRNPTAELRSTITMVGDRPDTDGGMAQRFGGRFALVLSGVTVEDDLPVVPVPAVIANDLRTLVDTQLRG